MQVALELYSGNRRLLRREIAQTTFRIGSLTDCDLCLPELPPLFADIHFDGIHLQLVNKSDSEIFVGDEAIRTECRLADGDMISLSEIKAKVCFFTPTTHQGNTKTLPQGQSTVQPHYLLAPQVYPQDRWLVDVAGITIGSDPSNTIVLPDPYVSAFHARVQWYKQRCILTDLNSRNGSFVDNRQVQQAEIAEGMHIRLGQSVLLLQSEQTNAMRPKHRPLIGSSRAMQKIRSLIGKVASNEAPVLVMGETGTGKEVVAHWIAEMSAKTNEPFVVLNCGAINRNLVESELFGHEKGSFTGAIGRKIGAFEAAHNGILFLDEIGELPLELQPQLLRVLETGEVRRVGSTQTMQVNVKVIAATHRNLSEHVEKGLFREDLLHRLHVLVLQVPSLREKSEDIPELASAFLREFAPSGVQLSLTPAAITKLCEHNWPGNVRELRNVLQRAILMRDTEVIDADHLTFAPTSVKNEIAGVSLSEIERNAIIKVLKQTNGNKKEAAEVLKISRSTMHRKIDEYSINDNEWC